jgi:Lrp/AsnC family leucine-responsive transcriptional regulator
MIKTYSTKPLPGDFIETKNDKDLSKNNFKPDKKDREIINQLSINARFSAVDIAEKVNLSADAVTYRIKNLIKNKIIIKFITAIDPSKLGYSFYTILMNINLPNEELEKKLMSNLKNNSNIIWSAKMIGSYNLLIYLLAKNVEEIKQAENEIKELFPNNINQHDLLMTYKQHKYTYLPENLI